jgi:acetyl-CoA C-acetyltransferase
MFARTLVRGWRAVVVEALYHESSATQLPLRAPTFNLIRENTMAEAMIFDAIRTPRGRGKASGALYDIKPVNLLAGALNALADRHDLDTSQVDDVVIGCVSAYGEQGSCIGKTAALAAGWDWKAAGFQLNRFCGSGLEAVNLAAQKIRSDWEDLVVAGGVESMSRVPIGSDGGPWAQDPETNLATQFIPQGISADLIATLEGFTREQVDEFAMGSHQKAAAARAAGYFNKSIVPVIDRVGLAILEQDETIRPGTTVEALGALKVSFDQAGKLGFDAVALQKYPQVERIRHIHTAGNSSGIVDGAAAVLIGNEKKGRELGLNPRGRIVAAAITGEDPTIMLTGPAPAARKALARAGMTVDQIDLFEVNEAFAVVPMKFMKELGVPAEKVNVNGGSIAMGHPLGATGAMILGTMLDELERRRLRYGLATLCIGGGMGIATIIERL